MNTIIPVEISIPAYIFGKFRPQDLVVSLKKGTQNKLLSFFFVHDFIGWKGNYQHIVAKGLKMWNKRGGYCSLFRYSKPKSNGMIFLK